MKKLIIYSTILICFILICFFLYKKYNEYHYYDVNYKISNYKLTSEKINNKDVDSLLRLFKETDSLKCPRERHGEIARKVVYDNRLLGKNEKTIRKIFGVPNEIENNRSKFKNLIFYSACYCDSNNRVIKNSAYGKITFNFYNDKLYAINEMFE